MDSSDEESRDSYSRLQKWRPSSCFNSITFAWLSPLLKLGKSKEQLELEDLLRFPLPSSCEAENVWDSFYKHWSLEKEKKSLSKCLFQAYWVDFAYAGLLKLLHDCCQFVGPFVLRALIQFLRDDTASFVDGLWLTLAVTLSQTVMTISLRHYNFKCNLTGLRMRTTIVLAIHKKALVLTCGEKQRLTSGNIVNLESVDAQRIQDLPTYVHAVWFSFIQIIISLYFLWGQLGISSLGGFAVILLSLPINHMIAHRMGKLQKKVMLARDERVEMTNEVLKGMKGIKIQAWEYSFQSRIDKLRENELQRLKKYVIANSFSLLMWAAVPLLVSLSTFATHVLLGKDLDIANVLTALALFDILRVPVCMLPQVINSIVIANLSFDRIQRFLMCKEYHPVDEGTFDDIGVVIENATFIFDGDGDNLMEMKSKGNDLLVQNHIQNDQKQDSFNAASFPSNVFSLRHINFNCARGDLIAVVGSVGQGKSALMNCLLGEMQRISGTVKIKGKIAYCSQTPFILNDTVRNNILFSRKNEPFDIARYNNALSACDLFHDLQLLKNGDETHIGERGFTCSGGQKTRVALARCLYDDADIYILDDPLASVDARVGKHLFKRCIVDDLLLNKNSHLGRGRKRIVILVTHAIQYLSDPNVKKIFVLDQGQIAEVGSYSQLSMNPKSLFTSFLSPTELDSFINTVNCDGQEATNFLKSKSISCEDGTGGKLTLASALVKMISDECAVDDDSSTLMTSEAHEREKGHVDLKVYLAWGKAAGGIFAAVLFFTGHVTDESVKILSKWWLTYWSRSNDDSNYWFLKIFACINGCALVTMTLRVVIVYLSGIRASSRLFKELLNSILRCPMIFFETTPTGRIINRFSKDVFILDEKLIVTIRIYFATISTCIGTIVIISIITPVFALFVIPMVAYYIRQQVYFTKTYRELKRLDLLNRSPLYALLGETLDGLTTIRAYQAESTILLHLTSLLNRQQNVSYLITAANSWLELRLEMIGTFIVFFACLSVILKHRSEAGNETFAGLAGLSISFALSVTQSLNFSVRMGSDLEADMVSVERIKQYTEVSSEAAESLPIDETLGEWPEHGEIIFKECLLRYRPNLPLALKGLNIKIPSGSKVGVVGRTGAGKSTIVVALLRLVELSGGSITIDGIDISQIGLRLLRSRLAVIPQDPILFSGTIRSNLDPFNDFQDEKLIEVLLRVGLKNNPNYVSSDENTDDKSISLNDPVCEGGSNYSIGQRQLLVLSRALLKGAKVVIMDEATASVDNETDRRIQRVMRDEFKNSTCITVAHRINSIMDSDYILVMDDGVASEFDKPDILLRRQNGVFRNLVATWDETHN